MFFDPGFERPTSLSNVKGLLSYASLASYDIYMTLVRLQSKVRRMVKSALGPDTLLLLSRYGQDPQLFLLHGTVPGEVACWLDCFFSV